MPQTKLNERQATSVMATDTEVAQAVAAAVAAEVQQRNGAIATEVAVCMAALDVHKASDEHPMYLKGGRLVSNWAEGDGFETIFQPALFGNNVVIWLPNNSNAVSIAFGSSFTNQNNGSGSGQTTPTLSGTNAVTQMKRAAFSTGTSNSGYAGVQTAAPVTWRGNKAGLGGFFFFARFALEAYATNERLLVGLSAQSGGLNVQPSSLDNTIALIKDSGDTTLQILCSNGTNATKINTGVTPAVDQILDLTLYCKPNDTKVYARLTDGLTGTVYVDDLVLTATLPDPAVFLYMHAHIQATSGSIAKLLSVNRLYLETNT